LLLVGFDRAVGLILALAGCGLFAAAFLVSTIVIAGRQVVLTGLLLLSGFLIADGLGRLITGRTAGNGLLVLGQRFGGWLALAIPSAGVVAVAVCLTIALGVTNSFTLTGGAWAAGLFAIGGCGLALCRPKSQAECIERNERAALEYEQKASAYTKGLGEQLGRALASGDAKKAERLRSELAFREKADAEHIARLRRGGE
jgi:hypothetical protein